MLRNVLCGMAVVCDYGKERKCRSVGRTDAKKMGFGVQMAKKKVGFGVLKAKKKVGFGVQMAKKIWGFDAKFIFLCRLSNS